VNLLSSACASVPRAAVEAAGAAASPDEDAESFGAVTVGTSPSPLEVMLSCRKPSAPLCHATQPPPPMIVMSASAPTARRTLAQRPPSALSATRMRFGSNDG